MRTKSSQVLIAAATAAAMFPDGVDAAGEAAKLFRHNACAAEARRVQSPICGDVSAVNRIVSHFVLAGHFNTSSLSVSVDCVYSIYHVKSSIDLYGVVVDRVSDRWARLCCRDCNTLYHIETSMQANGYRLAEGFRVWNLVDAAICTASSTAASYRTDEAGLSSS